MNPGLFKHKITFQKFAETENDIGDTVETWHDFKSVWAMIKTLQGREYISAAAVSNENTVRFVIRYTVGIVPEMRIIHRNRLFEIESVINDDELNKTLTIIGKEVV